MEIDDYVKNNELVPFDVIEESNELIGTKFWSTYYTLILMLEPMELLVMNFSMEQRNKHFLISYQH